MVDFDKFAKEVVCEILEDGRRLIVLKNPNNHSIDVLVDSLRAEMKFRGKSLKIVQHDSPDLRNLGSLNGTVYLTVNNNPTPELNNYLIDVNWVIANYQ